MREKNIVNYLNRASKAVTLPELQRKMNLSANTIRSLIDRINDASQINGFKINYEKKQGYELMIHDYKLFQEYLNQPLHSIDYSRQDQRVHLILFYILQNNDFTTIDELCDRTGLSRSTLIKDLKQVEIELDPYQISLYRKQYYGMKITGDEKNIRKAFSAYVIQSELYMMPVKGYYDFLEHINVDQLREAILNLMHKNQIKISDLAFDNLLTHFQVLLYRTIQNNTIVLNANEIRIVDQKYLNAAKEMSVLAQNMYGLSFNESEIKYFALDLQSKAMVNALPFEEKRELENAIHEMMKQLDKEFYTDFSEDEELISNLLLHLYPLLNRINYNFQLRNPMIDEICMEFVNVFVVALRFAQLIHERWCGCELSRDEVGFLTLHFAVYFEKIKNFELSKIKRIAVICSTGKSSAMLIKLKLETIFANASIITSSSSDISRFDEELPNLFLSTIPFEQSYHGIPVIQIKEFLNEVELKRIKDLTALKITHSSLEAVSYQILPLFKEAFFQVISSGNYLNIIDEQARKMVHLGVAASEFPEYVREREMKYPTIFMNGIASPHPIHLNAIENCIGVTILEEPIFWEDKEVKMIFLINLKSECLYFHQEIQRLLLKIIENDEFRTRIASVRKYDGLIYEIKNSLGERKYE